MAEPRRDIKCVPITRYATGNTPTKEESPTVFGPDWGVTKNVRPSPGPGADVMANPVTPIA